MTDDLGRPLSLERAATVACLTPKYFSRLFKRRVGIGFSTWLKRLRIERAKRILAEDDRSIVDVATAVGMSARTLERSFRTMERTSPGAYRREARWPGDQGDPDAGESAGR